MYVCVCVCVYKQHGLGGKDNAILVEYNDEKTILILLFAIFSLAVIKNNKHKVGTQLTFVYCYFMRILCTKAQVLDYLITLSMAERLYKR